MKTNAIKDQIRNFLNKYVKDPELAEDKDLFASGLLNSLFAMQLVLFVEKEFELQIENEDLDINNFNSINAVSNFIARKSN